MPCSSEMSLALHILPPSFLSLSSLTSVKTSATLYPEPGSRERSMIFLALVPDPDMKQATRMGSPFLGEKMGSIPML